MHVHTSALDGFLIGAWFLIWGYLFRLAATTWPNSSVAKALSFIH